MSGLAAPARISMPIPERAMAVRVAGTILPACTNASSCFTVRKIASNGSPPSTRRSNAVDTPYSMTTVFPVARSNCGRSSCITGLKAVEHRTLISAPRAALA